MFERAEKIADMENILISSLIQFVIAAFPRAL